MKTASLLLLLACLGLVAGVHGAADDGLEEFRQPEDDAPYFWGSHIKPRPFGRRGRRQDPIYEQCRTEIYNIYSCLPEIRRSSFYPNLVLSKDCCDNLRNIQEECFHRAIDSSTFIAFKYWFKQHCPSTVPSPPSPPPAGGDGGQVPSQLSPAPAPSTGGDGGGEVPSPASPPPAGGDGGQVPSQPSPAPAPSTGGDGGGEIPSPASPPPAGGDDGQVPSQPSPAPAPSTGGGEVPSPSSPPASPPPAGGDDGQVPSQPSPAPAPSTGGDGGSKSPPPAPAPAPAPADDDNEDLCDFLED